MKLNMDNDTQAVAIQSAVPQVTEDAVMPAHTLQEEAELRAELDSLRQEIEGGLGDTTQPTVLADSGVVFDIVNAFTATMREDNGEERSKVVFEIVEQDTGVFHRVMQSDDSRGIRRKYARLFGLCRAMNVPTEPLVGYQFVYGDKVVAGNKAIILQRAPALLDRAAQSPVVDGVIVDAE